MSELISVGVGVGGDQVDVVVVGGVVFVQQKDESMREEVGGGRVGKSWKVRRCR